MFKRILVPLDGSELAEQAIPVAARLARASGRTIVFVQVVLPPVEFGTYSVEQEHVIDVKPSAYEKRLAEAESYLLGTANIHADVLAGIATEIDITTGAAAPTIFSTARLEEVDLIVMYSHGETGLKRWVFGSVAQQAVRHSPVPVLVLHEQGMALRVPDAAHPLRILVPLDGSALAETALEPAIELLKTWTGAPAEVGGELHLQQVVDVPPTYGKFRSQAYVTDGLLEEVRHQAQTYVKTVADQLRAGPLAESQVTLTSGISVKTDVAGTIVRLAEHAENAERTGGYDLIAMATHGRSGLLRLVMGSVTEHVLGATKLPLLMVRPPQPKTQQEEVAQTVHTRAGTVAEEQGWVGLL